MAATLHILHPQTPPLAGFLRVGHTGQRKLEHMHAAGRFPFRRIVFEAAHIDEQKDLLRAFRGGGHEIVLDPNFAEMASAGKFESAVRKLPWANAERPWRPADFDRTRNLDIARQVAEFAVGHGVNVVLAPSHLIESADSSWRSLDRSLCERLRRELDRAGGATIAIGFQIITMSAVLKDERGRSALAAGIGDLPVENVWLRTSGFGAKATGVGTRSYIEAVCALHSTGRPLVGDMVGGFSGLAAGAFGALGGVSHGVAQMESFDTSGWRKPSTGGGGSVRRVYIHELDRYFTEGQLDALFAAKGGRSRFGCNDTNCCRHGREDMIENAHVHFLNQRRRQLDDLSSVPELRRAEHFLLRHLDPAVRSARHAAHLRIVDEKVKKIIDAAKSRLIRLRDALADLQQNDSLATRSRSPTFRGGSQPISALLGR